MVVVRGRSPRFAAIVLISAAIFAFMGLRIYFVPPKIDRPDWTEAQKEQRLRTLQTVKPLLLGVFFAPMTLLFGYVGLLFAGRCVYLRISADGLHFGWLPGVRKGRLVRWDQLMAVRPLDADQIVSEARWLFALITWGFGRMLYLRIDLNCPSHETIAGGAIVKLLGRLNDGSIAGWLAGRPRGYWALEIIGTGGIPHGVLIEAIQALHRNTSLRQSYCETDEHFEICLDEQGRIAFHALI